MSLKKDNFNKLDKHYMNIAINLAKNHIGLTGTNPSVGCVIVKENKILSFGTTNFNGRPHAESTALNKNKKEIAGSTLYVTLEPCSHFGKTPPCVMKIIKSKVKKVNYSIEDSDLRSFCKSKKILNSKKILTKSGLSTKQVKNLYYKYNYIKKNKYPYVVGKIACSADLYILKNNKIITNEHSRKVSHLLRFKNQGILTSYKTINSDNPKLTCRIKGLENFSPTRLIIDKDLKINMNSFVIKNSKNKKTYIFHNSKNLKKINNLKKNGLNLIYNDVNSLGYIDIKKLFKKIYNIGIHYLLVECGKKLTTNILKEKLFNEFYLFKSNKNINNKYAINVKNINKYLNKTFIKKKKVNTYLDKDILIHYY